MNTKFTIKNVNFLFLIIQNYELNLEIVVVNKKEVKRIMMKMLKFLKQIKIPISLHTYV